MPVTFAPLENNRIMAISVSDPWKVEDLMAWYPTIQPYFDQNKGRVHTLIDVSAMKTIPAVALKGRHSPSVEHPNSGYTVFVGGTNLIRSVAQLAFELSRNRRFKFVESTEQALAFLKQQIEAENDAKKTTDG